MNALVVAVHPDDETLGCGGTLLRMHAEGARLHWLLVTAAYEPEFTAEYAELQRREVDKVREAYSFDSLNWLRLPACRLDSLPRGDLIRQIRQIVQSVRPELLFVPNRSDVHSDHRVISDVMQSVAKSFYMKQLGISRVLACEVPSETDASSGLDDRPFQPNYFVDVSGTICRKLDIMSLYGSQVHPDPLPRSLSALQALARVRGASIGVSHAEAFMLIREIL